MKTQEQIFAEILSKRQRQSDLMREKNQLDKEIEALYLESERLKFDGLTQWEKARGLSKQTFEVDGMTFKYGEGGYEIHLPKHPFDEDTEISCYGYLYVNDSRFKFWVKRIKSNRDQGYWMNEVPKKYKEFADKVIGIMQGLQFIESASFRNYKEREVMVHED